VKNDRRLFLSILTLNHVNVRYDVSERQWNLFPLSGRNQETYVLHIYIDRVAVSILLPRLPNDNPNTRS
jgi:hypothetical protein